MPSLLKEVSAAATKTHKEQQLSAAPVVLLEVISSQLFRDIVLVKSSIFFSSVKF